MTGFDDEDVDDLDTDENAEVSAEADGEDSGEAEQTEDAEALEEEDYDDSLDDDIDEYGEDTDDDLKLADEILNHKDENAKALAIRRAIEERQEAKRISRDLDYLDLDLDD